MSIPEHYRRETQRYLENCTQCGLCARGCPILPHTDVAEFSSREIQTSVYFQPEKILQDAAERIATSPFPRERIVEVMRSVFTG